MSNLTEPASLFMKTIAEAGPYLGVVVFVFLCLMWISAKGGNHLNDRLVIYTGMRIIVLVLAAMLWGE